MIYRRCSDSKPLERGDLVRWKDDGGINQTYIFLGFETEEATIYWVWHLKSSQFCRTSSSMHNWTVLAPSSEALG